MLPRKIPLSNDPVFRDQGTRPGDFSASPTAQTRPIQFRGRPFRGPARCVQRQPAGRLGRILFDRFVRSREIAPEALTPVDRQAHVGRTGNHRGTACYGQRGPEHRTRQTTLCLAGPHAGEELQPQAATAPSCGLRICHFASRLGVSIRAFQHRFDRLNRRARDRPAGLDQHAIRKATGNSSTWIFSTSFRSAPSQKGEAAT